MTALRNIALCVLIVLMLPWGAFLRAQAADASAAAAPVAGLALISDSADRTHVAVTPASVSETAIPWKCRTTTVPGSSCAAYLIPETTDPSHAQASRRAPMRPEAGHWPARPLSAPETGPPRAV